MKKIKKERPSKLDLVVESTTQNYKDCSTDDVARRRSALDYDAALTEGLITTLVMKLTDARTALAHNEAERRGLAAILGKR